MTQADKDAPLPEHQPPDWLDEETIEAVGRLSEALETCERARGHLYSFHQLTGESDLKLDDAIDQLRSAGHTRLADMIERELLGRNVLPGRWTFQLIEEYDDCYWSVFREMEALARAELTAGRRHLAESRMKESRRTHGHSAHTARPS